MAELEWSRIRERQVEGIALAKAKDVYEEQRALSTEDVHAVGVQVDLGIPVAEVTQRYSISRQTLYAAIKGRGAYRTECLEGHR